MLKITHQIHPAQKCIQSYGEAFSTMTAFDSLLKSLDYTMRKTNTAQTKKDLYESQDKTHKLTLEQWNVKIGEKKLVRLMAGIAIVPFEGDDIIE